MISNEKLRSTYAKNCENTVDKKYKWYSCLSQLAIDKDEILKDNFWNASEKEKIKLLLKGWKIQNWHLETRLCHDTHLDVCIIYKK